MSLALPLNPLITLELASNYGARICFSDRCPSTSQSIRRKSSIPVITCTRRNDSQGQGQGQVNLSVLRFTLGIPGLDESYLPRWIGYSFGLLLLLNHFVGLDPRTITSAQLRTEVLGLCLSTFSTTLPYLGKFLKGATPVDQKTIPDGARQIFVMAENVPDPLKEDLAWGTYTLFRNTKSISVLIAIQEVICARGYWNTPEHVTKINAFDWFEKEIQQIGLPDLDDTFYCQDIADSELWVMLPKGTRSVLVQPLSQASNRKANQRVTDKGFILLASSTSYAYNSKDRDWVGAVARKFTGKSIYI